MLKKLKYNVISIKVVQCSTLKFVDLPDKNNDICIENECGKSDDTVKVSGIFQSVFFVLYSPYT